MVKATKPEPKGRPLEVEEIAKLLQVAEAEHLKILIVFMLGTAARTSAVLGLKLDQIDLNNQLIQLNPTGRAQTLKYRATVKLPGQLVAYVEKRKKQATTPDEPLVCYQDGAVGSVKRSWNRARNRAALPGNVQTYSFRHTMARWMRMQGVPAWEVAAQLGHKVPDYSTTEVYAPFDPAYLSNAIKAIDGFFCELACQLRVSSMSDFLLSH